MCAGFFLSACILLAHLGYMRARPVFLACAGKTLQLPTMSERVERILQALVEANDEASFLLSPDNDGSLTPAATRVQGSMITNVLQELQRALARKGVTPRPDFATALAQATELAETIQTPTTSQAPSEGTVDRVQEAYENVAAVAQRKKTLRPAPAPAPAPAERVSLPFDLLVHLC